MTQWDGAAKPRAGEARSWPGRATPLASGAAPLALITGASSGIGEAFARCLAATGHGVLLVARRDARLRELAADLAARFGVLADSAVADLACEDDARRLAARVADLPALDVLVHAAGFGVLADFAAADVDAQLDMVRVHDLAAVRLVRAALPGMLARRRGGVVLVSSIGAFAGAPGNAVYCATKAFLNVFAEGLAAEVRGRGVRVQALCPGFTRTQFHAHAAARSFEPSLVPSWLWMDAGAVAARSLAALGRGPVVFVPGRHNQILSTAARSPLLRPLWRAAARRLGRGREASGRIAAPPARDGRRDAPAAQRPGGPAARPGASRTGGEVVVNRHLAIGQHGRIAQQHPRTRQEHARHAGATVPAGVAAGVVAGQSRQPDQRAEACQGEHQMRAPHPDPQSLGVQTGGSPHRPQQPAQHGRRPTQPAQEAW